MSATKATQKSAKSTTATNKQSKGFTDEERAAMTGARPRGQGGRAPRLAPRQPGSSVATRRSSSTVRVVLAPPLAMQR